MTVEATYFQPWHIGLYLFVVFVIMVVYYQWKWASTCKNNIQVLVAQSGGGGEFVLSPKTGGEVAIKNPTNDTVRMWPLNELSTIEVPYPGVGFIPAFLQKTIRLAIVNEGDWEPMLNRSRHYENVASPDVVDQLLMIAHDSEDAGGGENVASVRVKNLVKQLSTSPTREMIASPAVLGNLMHEKITEAVITVNKEMMDQMQGIMGKLNNILSVRVFYIGIGIVVVAVVTVGFLVIPVMGEISEKLDRVMQAIGVATGGQ